MGQGQPPYPPPPQYGQMGPPPGAGRDPYPQPGPSQPWQGGPPRARKGSESGWLIAIAVILGGVVLFGGVLAVLAIYGLRKYIASAKVIEARNSLGAIGRGAVIAFERERDGSVPHRQCASASHSVPDSIVKVSGRKYISSAADWQVDAPHHGGFACLRFSLVTPQYYMYSYRIHGAYAVGDGFEATAQGDLNGDGKTSLFRTTGTIAPGGTLDVAPDIYERDPTE
jgi:type IV pilus assembly protein PilA